MPLPFNMAAKTKSYLLSSPDGNITVSVSLTDTLSYSVSNDGRPVSEKIKTALATSKGLLGVNPKLRHVSRNKVRDSFSPVVPLKYSTVADNYNSMILDFKDGYSVELRAYDDGIAHRFITSIPGEIEVADEIYDVTVNPGVHAHLQQPSGFKTSYEDAYSHKPMTEWTASDRMSTLPVLLQDADESYVLISESDLSDYPAMFLKGDSNGSFHAVFPKVPVKFGEDGDRSVKILEEAPYIALTEGTRNFPWRFMAIGSGKDIVGQTMSARLAERNSLPDTSWIKPGTASWEWWNGATPYGDDVEFESGFNMNTYKYFIDFAAKYGIPYIIMDEGWAMDTRDPYTPNPEVDVHEIVRYGKEKGVGVFLWLTWLTVENNFDLFKTFSDWGVKGVKIDFMDRSDQWMVDFYERVCKEAARNHLLVDMHGSFKPAGLEQKYPNLLSYEGVRGMEQMGGCRPDNSLYLPFMRNAVGPMDYTPGAMLSMQPEYYASERPNSASIGTRAYQMALFVVFESGLQMLADNPTLYYRNDDCTRFITSVPVTWDDTKVIEAVPGEYIIVAKRKGDRWFVGGITNGKEKHRSFDLNLDFLSPGTTYTMTSFEDGINAHRQAMDYRRKQKSVDVNTQLSVKMARNGGWTAVFEPNNK
ncbi:MAG: glycoside hydrolase family 97 protein [Bacteroides sp.]|nr:glycoside hydrolase family 97 protein [Bacteroides sp.]